MKIRELIQGIISTMQSEMPFDVIDRELELPVDSGQMITVTGVRRCGKSSIMKIVANRLLASGVPKERILWINFDDERLAELKTSDLDECISAYREMFPDVKLSQVYMFFDELQLIDNWELFPLRLYKSYCKNIYISGSNSKMLSSQLSSALRGWPVEYTEFPLSFAEYIRFKGIDCPPYSEEGRNRRVLMCREYLHSSSFPEIALMKEESLKIRKVQSYYNTMIFRDLIDHYGLKNPEVVKYVLRRMLANISKPTSFNAIYNDIKSQGRKLDKNSVYELGDMVCSNFMFFKVSRWSRSTIKENSYLPKFYFIDNGMRNSILMPQSHDDGILLENAVFLRLLRLFDNNHKITYFNENRECDFVIQSEDRVKALYQVCWTIEDDSTKEREIAGLLAAAEATHCDNLNIITFDEEETITRGGRNIEVIPAWKWL